MKDLATWTAGLESRLLPGERIEAAWNLWKAPRGGDAGFFALTTLRVLVLDRSFDEQKFPSYVSIPYAQIAAVAAQSEGSDTGSRSGSSTLMLMTAAGSQRFVLGATDGASNAERLIVGHILPRDTAVESWATVLRAGALVMERMDPRYRAAAPDELMAQARQAAQSGRDPSQALADVLTDVGLLNDRT